MAAKSFIREELELNDELMEEREMATRRCWGVVNIQKATRLTFFGSTPKGGDWRNKAELPDEDIIGYAIVVTLQLPGDVYRTFLLEAVIRTPSIGYETEEGLIFIDVPNYYIHNSRDLTASVGPRGKDRQFTIHGTFFTQQNDLTSVCSHAALRMMINSSSRMQIHLQKVIGDGLLTNKYINDVLGLDFSSPLKSVGHYEKDPPHPHNRKGLTVKDIDKVVQSLDARLLVQNFTEQLPVHYDEIMYPLVESLCPTLLEVQGWDVAKREEYAHVLAVMGHTLNSDRWEPEANIGYGSYPLQNGISACQWICHYIISDDNYGMNLTLPSDAVRNHIVPHENPKTHAVRLMSIVPRKMTISGYTAQRIAVDIAKRQIEGTSLSRKVYWLDKLKETMQKGDVVCRTTLVEGAAYASYIDDLSHDGPLHPTAKQKTYFGALPAHVWVTEVTLPNLYAGNKAKLADILIDACADQSAARSRDCVMLAWFPGFIRLGIPKRIEYWDLEKHVPLIRQSPEPMIEW
jgi:hypothetical protein